MKKLVIKTALITLAVIVAISCVLMGFFALFFPKNLGNFFAKCGSYHLASSLYERNYERERTVDSLVLLIDHLDPYKDDDTADFIEDMIEIYGIETVSDAEYYYGKYVVSLAFDEDVDDAVLGAKQFVKEYGYTAHNPYRTLISDTKLRLRKGEWTQILNALKEEREKLVDTLEIDKDIAIVEGKIN